MGINIKRSISCLSMFIMFSLLIISFSSVAAYESITGYAPKNSKENFKSASSSAPVISNVYVTNVNKEVAVAWTTNVPADSQVEYGKTPAYGQNTTLDTALTTLHKQVLTNLSHIFFGSVPHPTRDNYHYRIRSQDVNGNIAVSKDYFIISRRIRNPTTGAIKYMVLNRDSTFTASQTQTYFAQLSNFWRANSYGKTHISETGVFGPSPLYANCSYSNYFGVPGVNWSYYDKGTWIGVCGTNAYLDPFYTLAHEQGHSLGFGHASVGLCEYNASTDTMNCYRISEYGDPYSVMGERSNNLDDHYVSAQKEHIGWLTEDTVPALIPVTASGTYTITNFITQDSAPKTLKIERSFDHVTGARTYYYLDLRDKARVYGEQRLVPAIILRVAKPAFYPWSDGSWLENTVYIENIRGLNAGKSFSDPEAGINITVLSASSTSASIKVTLNRRPPFVRFISPVANSVFKGPASFTLTAEASDPDGIANVTFYNYDTTSNNLRITELGTDATPPYTASLDSLSAGSYDFFIAKATNTRSKSSWSAWLPLFVLGNSLPQVSIVSPPNLAGYTSPATFTLIANASDPDGIAKVEFFSFHTERVKIGEDTTPPYTWTVENLSAYARLAAIYYYARAIGVKGNTGTSPYVLIYIEPRRFTLNVTKVGIGTGKVTSGVGFPFIDCGSACSAAFNEGTNVTLDAAPDAGSVFRGWGGACSGTTPTCNLTIWANTSVSANFDISSGGASVNQRGLVAHYTFDGSFRDSSGSGNDVTPVNGVALLTLNTNNQVAQFDGFDDYIYKDSLNSVSPSTFTISLWIKKENAGQGKDTLILFMFGDGAAISTDGDYAVYQARSDEFWQTNNWDRSDAPFGMLDNQWHHLVASYNGSQAVAYLNGIRSGATLPHTILTAGDNALVVGRQPDYNIDFFKGLIDELLIYNRTLSAAEVSELYSNQKSSYVELSPPEPQASILSRAIAWLKKIFSS